MIAAFGNPVRRRGPIEVKRELPRRKRAALNGSNRAGGEQG